MAVASEYDNSSAPNTFAGPIRFGTSIVTQVTRLAAPDGIGEDRVAYNDRQDEAGSNEDNDQRPEGRSGLVDGQLARNHILKRRPTSQYL